MKNIIALLSFTALIDILAIAGTFSQKAKPAQRPVIDSTAVFSSDPRFKKFVADTTELNKKFHEKVDCLRIEHSIAKEKIITENKELVATQKTNHQGLSGLRKLLNHGLRQVEENTFSLPDISYARPSGKIRPLPVNIDTVPPDTLVIPEHKRSIFDRIFRFWKW